jgi:hypothetical protein
MPTAKHMYKYLGPRASAHIVGSGASTAGATTAHPHAAEYIPDKQK